MKQVKNLATGIVHTVNDSHWAIDHPDYKLIRKRTRRKKKANDGLDSDNTKSRTTSK